MLAADNLDASKVPELMENACEDSWGWDDEDKSHEVVLSDHRKQICHFHPLWSNSTAGVRGTRLLNGGRFYWQIHIDKRLFGTRQVNQGLAL